MIDNEDDKLAQEAKHEIKLRKLAAEKAREIEKLTIDWANETCNHDKCINRPEWKTADAETKYPIGPSYCEDHFHQMLTSIKKPILMAWRNDTIEEGYKYELQWMLYNPPSG